jgi:hypothetical protein
VASSIDWLGTSLLQRDELIAQIDERGTAAFPTQLEVEQPAIEGQGFLDIPNLQRYVIEANRA